MMPLPDGLQHGLTEMFKVPVTSYLLNNLIFKLDIPQLPMVKVDQERVDNGVQCTTCLETFTLDEKVAKLKCQVSHTE
jgi:hypothetical protein